MAIIKCKMCGGELTDFLRCSIKKRAKHKEQGRVLGPCLLCFMDQDWLLSWASSLERVPSVQVTVKSPVSVHQLVPLGFQVFS